MARAAFALAALLAASGAARAASLADQVQGDWLTADKGGVIRIHPCGDAICGTIVGVSEFPNGSPPMGKDGKPTCNRTIINGMRPDDDVLHGTVTDPGEDKVYTANLRIGDEGELRLRGYIGTPLLGRTEVWTRVKAEISKDCRFTLR